MTDSIRYESEASQDLDTSALLLGAWLGNVNNTRVFACYAGYNEGCAAIRSTIKLPGHELTGKTVQHQSFCKDAVTAG